LPYPDFEIPACGNGGASDARTVFPGYTVINPVVNKTLAAQENFSPRDTLNIISNLPDFRNERPYKFCRRHIPGVLPALACKQHGIIRGTGVPGRFLERPGQTALHRIGGHVILEHAELGYESVLYSACLPAGEQFRQNGGYIFRFSQYLLMERMRPAFKRREEGGAHLHPFGAEYTGRHDFPAGHDAAGCNDGDIHAFYTLGDEGHESRQTVFRPAKIRPAVAAGLSPLQNDGIQAGGPDIRRLRRSRCGRKRDDARRLQPAYIGWFRHTEDEGDGRDLLLYDDVQLPVEFFSDLFRGGRRDGCLLQPESVIRRPEQAEGVVDVTVRDFKFPRHEKVHSEVIFCLLFRFMYQAGEFTRGETPRGNHSKPACIRHFRDELRCRDASRHRCLYDGAIDSEQFRYPF